MSDFDTLQAEVAQISAVVADLSARMAHVEEMVAAGAVVRQAPASADSRAEGRTGEAVAPPGHALMACGGSAQGMQGTVSYRGTVRAGADALDREMSHSVAALLDPDGVEIASVLAAVASSTRLTILRTLLASPHDARGLRQALGPARADRLDHDLHDLLAAGLVTQPGDGRFRVAPGRVIPLLAILAAANDLRAPHGPS